jgi:hypothetical protein
MQSVLEGFCDYFLDSNSPKNENSSSKKKDSTNANYIQSARDLRETKWFASTDNSDNFLHELANQICVKDKDIETSGHALSVIKEKINKLTPEQANMIGKRQVSLDINNI